MLEFLHFFSEPPSLKQLPLKRYGIDFSLSRLHLGVDNIHIDVHISPQVYSSVKRLALLLTIKHAGAETFSSDYRIEDCEKEKKTLRDFCTEILLAGINMSRSESEVQIDFLGQAALAKLFLEETVNAYGKLLQRFESLIGICELSQRHDLFESFRMKEKLSEIRRNRRQVISLVRKDLFWVFADVQAGSLRHIRELNFQSEHILPDHFFNNPALYSDRPGDDFLLVEDYVLFGQRADDPDNDNTLEIMIDELLNKTDLVDEIIFKKDLTSEDVTAAAREEDMAGEQASVFDPWLMDIDNIDLMFDYFDLEPRYMRSRARKEAKHLRDELKAQISVRRKLLNLFYRKFKQSRLIKLVVAAPEVKAIYRHYCPPLRPLQVREFLVKPGSRKNIIQELKSRRSSLRNDVSTLILPLYAAIDRMKQCSSRERKQHLFNFIRHFTQYRRDRHNARILRAAMDMITLVKDEKILLLSRENRSLYEFLLPEERVMQEKPITGHVIVKADIRGSMDITSSLRDRGLNPASYFSLNFFDPISEILIEYGGAKEFLEGDAIILSIFEHEDRPEGWYSVARACALAVRMLRITEQYNANNQNNHLPLLEFGIGICYQQGPPTFLFDGNNRITISPAINLADRLSSCDKILRRQFRNQSRIFNLYVYQRVPEKELSETADDDFLRYNVNGIELSVEGFVKLCREIKLTKVMYPLEGNEPVTLYAGKVPTLTGHYQPIVIREDAIVGVKPGTMDVIGKAAKKYYEVCVNPAIYEYAKSHI